VVAIEIRTLGVVSQVPERLHEAVQKPEDLIDVGFERPAVKSGYTRIIFKNDVGDLVSDGFVYLIEFGFMRSKRLL
jgi:hypothetical protein